MKRFVCPICGYVHEGNEPPAFCPQCKCPGAKFKVEEAKDLKWACEHTIGIPADTDAQVVEGLKANFTGECTEVGMYLAMSRQAEREGYPEVADAYKRYAFEEAEHAAKFAELLGEVVTSSTEKNVQLLIMQWFATRCKSYDAAPDDQKKAKLDAISAELTNVQGFYNGIREAAKKKPLTQSELLREFEMSVESWCEFASLEELAKILWFKDLVVGIVANQKAGASFAAFSYPPLVPSKSVSAEDQDSENGQNKLFEFKDGYAGKAADAVRNYFFKPKAE